MLDLAGHLADQRRVRAAPLVTGRVAGEHPEAVGVVLDVLQQHQGRPLEQLPRVTGRRQRRGEAVEQELHLAVDDDGVEPLLAAEVLVDDRLADVGAGGDLLDRGRLVALLAEQLAADVEQLLAPLGAGHPDPGARRAARLMPAARRVPASGRTPGCRGGARLAASRTGSGHLTSRAQPSFSNAQITRALMSIWPRSTPCRAQVGSAWCRLCHDSPPLRIASGQKFVARSRPGETKGRLPTTWQTELIDHVTWCSSATRTRPAQKNADQAPVQLCVTSPPMSGRQGEAQEGPEAEQPAGDDQALVLEQVGGVALGVGLPAVEQPAQVRVEHALDQRAGVVAVAPRRVRVALAVGEGVVPAVVGDPLDDGALDRHAADRGERQPQRPDGLERPVGEVAGGSRR